MMIEYSTKKTVSVAEFVELLQRSSLAERRPVHDASVMRGMIENSNLIVSAWHGKKLVGISRCMTDFHYACYLSDLAVDQNYQRSGIGKQLIANTKAAIKESCKIILLAAPAANEYYAAVGFKQHDRCWVLSS